LLLAHLELQDWHCLFCRVKLKPNGRLAERPTLEHLDAESSLGRSTFWNTAATCRGCNQDKGHLSEREYRAVLAVRREPAA
jgi:5-methylcytosine-specific restriction endonuclease McrA